MNMEPLKSEVVVDPTTNPLYKELYFLIAKFLSGGPCQRTSQTLIEELEANEIIPTSVNWLGEAIPQDYRTFSSKFDHINPQHLPKLLTQLIKTINTKESSSNSVASRSLLSYSTYSLINNKSPDSYKKSEFSWSKKYGQNLLLRSFRERKSVINPVQAIMGRSLSGCGVSHDLIRPDFYKRMGISCNTLGHLSAVYCVLFDVTGKYIFTGADDHLVKIWSAIDGRLLATLRGTSSEISDLAVNFENTLLAVASMDKMIRVWCLRTCSPVAVLNGHSGNVTSIFFCPIPRSRSVIRYLGSTSTDGSCAFWAYCDEDEADEPVQFQLKPTLYQERMRPGNAQMICSSFSSGGIFMAAGSADNHVRVYYMIGSDGPERILEVAHHTDRVDSISWAHEGLRFASGSKDGTALIWRFENSLWRYIRLHCGRNPGHIPEVNDDPKRRPRVTMVGWNADDSLVLTAVSDFMVKVWDSKTGELIRVLKEHSDETYVIEAHPINPRIVCTAGHDGKLIIWDVGTTSMEIEGGKVFEYHNKLSEGQGHGAVFDCKWSPDGLSLAATDSHGHLMIFTVEADRNTKFKSLPGEMFFHTDYRPVTRDAISNEIVDEQTQIPPHLMPPPFLVDVDGNPYPPRLQRLVPGRENVREEYLVPNVAMSAQGFQEVIEGLPARSNIDVMIQQLAIEQGLSGRNNRQSGGEGDRRGLGLRRSGEVEGVRQSRGDWQTGNYGFPKRHVVQALSKGTLASTEEVRYGWTEFEENWFNEHLKKSSPVNATGSSSSSLGNVLDSPGGRSRRIRRLALQAAERRQQQAMNQADFSQLEGVARPNPRPQMEISVNQESPRRPLVSGTPRRRNTPSSSRPSRPIRYDVRRILRNRGESDIENVDLDDSSSEAQVSDPSSDSSSSEDSDSDWGGTLGTAITRDHATKKKSAADNRKRSKRLNSSPSDQEDQHDSDDDQNDVDEPQPGPSAESTPSIKSEFPKQSRPRKARGKAVDYSGGLEEIPEQYRPCEWLAEVFARRSPYFPQLGDDLVYYRQGHEKYITYVETGNVYEIPPKLKKSLPYVQKSDLETEVPVRVVGIKFELQPPHLVALKLARTDWDTGELTGDNFYVKYHDAPDVVDFLILRQMYEKYIRRKWNEGDRFRCLIQREWWLGSVESLKPVDPELPNSMFLCYSVKWDSGEPETMSPWDMDIITDDFEIPEECAGKYGIPASEEDQRIGLYESTANDWPPHGHQDAQCQKISHLLEQVMGLAISEAFLTPVDLNLYPDYCYVIEYPIDLSTIKSRVDNRFYRRVDAFKFDVKYIAMNTEKFNQEDSDIVKHSRVIRDLCLEIIANPDMTDVNTVYHNIMKNYTKKQTANKESANKRTSTKSSNTGRSSNSTNGVGSSSQVRKSGRVRHNPARKYKSDSEIEDQTWQEQCFDLLNRIWHCKDAVPFRKPVDILKYPDYMHVIDTSMDLQTCKEELRGGNYESPLEFHKDMSMIFSNSKQYNTDKKSSIYSMTLRLNSMYDCQIKPILSKWRNRLKKSRSPSPPKRSRSGPSRACNSANSTPRKNPKRSAAVKNPYVHTEDQDSSEAEQHSDVGHNLRTRSNSKRSNGHRLGGQPVNGHSSKNGFSSPRGMPHRSSPSRPRAVKRFRISSGESHQSNNSPPRRKAKRNSQTNSTSTNSASSSKSIKRHKVPIKVERDSDEFEDSEEMPTLNKVNPPEMDADYSNSENDSGDEDDTSPRRSTRVRKRRGEESDDDYCYETRFRGRAVKSYAETHDGSDEDEERYGKRSRVITRRSPIRARGAHLPMQPPVLRQTAVNRISDTDDSLGDLGIDPDQPGPSSRMLRTTKPSNNRGRAGLNDEDEEEVEGSDSSEEHDSDDDEEDEYEKKVSKKITKRPLERNHVSSDDQEEYVASPRKKKAAASSSSRRATRGNRPDYAEESDDSESRITTVSSRGRVRRTKSFLGE